MVMISQWYFRKDPPLLIDTICFFFALIHSQLIWENYDVTTNMLEKQMFFMQNYS